MSNSYTFLSLGSNSSLWKSYHRATDRHLPYGISVTCQSTQVNAPRLNPSQAEGWKAK